LCSSWPNVHFLLPTLHRSGLFMLTSPTYQGGILVKLRCAKAPRNTGENEVGEIFKP
jgi:hypothetical protein